MSKKIILFVDNTPDFLETRAEFLKREGYQVLLAHSPAEAERLLGENRVHLVILDIRLVDDDDEKDISGILLAQQESFRNVPKIILTNFPSPSTFRTVLKSQPIDYVIKVEGPQALIDAVNSAFIHHVHINWSLTLDWQAINAFALVSRIEPGLERERLLNRAEELEDLFRRLFYEQERIRIDRVLWQRDARVALTVFAFKGTTMDSFVVVCGQNARVVEEASRFDKFAPKAQGETSTVLAARAETTHLAANAYALAHNADLETVRPLSEVYRAGDRKVFTAAIATLFEKTLAAWHSLPVPAEHTLEDWYRERLGLTAARIAPPAIHARWQALTRYLPELKQTVPSPEPISALLQSTDLKQSTLTIKTPGALTGDNILVDPNGRAWLTDFADVGDAPQFWNFIALESAIRFDWVEEKELKRLQEIEAHLLDDDRFGRPDPQGIESAAARQAVSFIQRIRRLAARAVGKDCLPYHLGIFFHAARRVADFDPAVTPTPNERARLAHALMAMALIATKVGQAERQVAAESARGLRVDKDGVKRDGKRISVRGQSLDLLHYLADPPNQLRTQREIIEKVLKEQFNERDKNQISRLHTAVRRLREKIEYDPDNPCFLLTETDGYRLVLQPDE